VTSLLPNILTASRLFAVPALVWLLLTDAGEDGELRWWALWLFLVAAATDFLDGYLARRWKVVSAFGKLADPIADKVLILAALATLSFVDGIPWWPVAILAAREIAVTVGRLMVANYAVIPANRGGKLKTTLQIAAVTVYIVPGGPAWMDVTAWWMLIAAVGVAVYSGVVYGRAIADARNNQELRVEDVAR